MSIKAIIDDNTYEGIKTINALGNVIKIEEISEATGRAVPEDVTAWDGSSEYSFGSIVKKIHNAKATGTFIWQYNTTEYIQIFDTGLGDNWNGIIIIDEEGTVNFTSVNDNMIWFAFVSREFSLRINKSANSSVAGKKDVTATNNYLRIENGVCYAKSLYNNNGYHPFVIGHTCKWFAW